MPLFFFGGGHKKNPEKIISQAFLDSIEITASDAWTLFASLDIDGDKVPNPSVGWLLGLDMEV